MTTYKDPIPPIRKWLLERREIASKLGGERIYTMNLPQNCVYPAVTMHISSQSQEHNIGDRTGNAGTRIQFECHSTIYEVANTVAGMIQSSGIAAIRGKIHGLDIQGVQVEDGQRNYINYADDASDDHTYVSQFDLMVQHKE